MPRISPRRDKAIIADLLDARHDLANLAAAHKLTPADLATWASESATRRKLIGLCGLADMQTQLLLSRYRMVAASRLIQLATEDAQGDLARKACVDLLKLDLKPLDAMTDQPDDDANPLAAPWSPDQLSQWLYGSPDHTPAPDPAPSPDQPADEQPSTDPTPAARTAAPPKRKTKGARP